jgi:hypothetical protein
VAPPSLRRGACYDGRRPRRAAVSLESHKREDGRALLRILPDGLDQLLTDARAARAGAVGAREGNTELSRCASELESLCRNGRVFPLPPAGAAQ